MMTMEERLRGMLLDHGMPGDQCDAVMELVKADGTNEAMLRRWDDQASGYPESVFCGLWLSAKHHALELGLVLSLQK